MRAPLALPLATAATLLLAAAVAAAATAPLPPPQPPRALLVLRAACRARDPAAFAPQSPALERRARRPLRVLDYEDTCGAEWSVAVTRESLAAMSGGGAVAVAGWPGAAACDALSAAARALRKPRPAVCALPAARAALVARLAGRLGWRRAVLPPAPPRSECRAASGEVARALAAVGITTVGRAPLSSDELTLLSHVVILCVSRDRGAADAAGAALVGGAGAVLLLHVEEPGAPSARALNELPSSQPHFAAEAVSYFANRQKYKNRAPEPSEDTFRGGFEVEASTLKFDYNSATRRDPSADTSDSPDRRRVKRVDPSHPKENAATGSDPVRVRRPDYIFSYIDESLPRRDLLLVSDAELDGAREPRDLAQVYAEALEALERAASAESARTETADITFHLYRRSEAEGGRVSPEWSRVGSISTASTRALDETSEWTTEVRAADVTDALTRLAESRLGGSVGSGGGGGAGVATLSAGAGVALAAVAALAARWAAARRRRRRRGGDALLSAADFSFPADERRCVGEGMETMLSCWLQQLHEFGGPELERPDLLKQPPSLRVPSAPSSTGSVNRIPQDRRIRYKGDAVHVKPLEPGAEAAGAAAGVVAEAAAAAAVTWGAGPLDLKRKAIDVLLVMQSLRHENLNPFIGCLCEARPALVWDHCGRGSLEDVLMADDIKLDWTFRLSLLTDLVRGMRYLHASPLRVHGRLSSRACVVDSRWVLRLTDYGLPAFERAQRPAAAPPPPPPPARALLWTAPELLRDPAARARGSQPGDVYSFAIVMQEVIVRGEPYCMLALTPDEIVEKLSRPPPLIRPSVSMGAAPPEAVSLMRQCWSEAPDLRPDFHRLHDLFRHLHRGRKINIVDSMFEMLEKYSNNLEELIKERTEQLDMEKKKTEQLLNRMLPRSVAERLLLGSRVEPEEFSDVTVYFSDIVGFTALAARSTPVQVVDLLNDLYTTFDAAIERYRVYKVETIGDAYMVVGGLPTRAADHAAAVATMALHLLHLAGRFRVRHLPDTPLRLRAGVHSGPCCAAVVGLTMPRYCLFGDTVNTASRMESTGAAWRIQVSAATAERLAAEGGFRLRSRGLVMIKGKGAMHTYWLLGKDGFDKPLPTPPPLESEEILFETDGENESDASSGPPSTPALVLPSPPAATPAPEPAAARSPHSSAPAPSREPRLEPDSATGDRRDQGSARSGAASAGSSPPHAGARLVSAASVDRVPAPYSRYRWGGGALRRQWSLERGEALATAAASRGSAVAPAQEAAPSPAPAPLALLASAPRAPPPRYRTRPGPPEEPP